MSQEPPPVQDEPTIVITRLNDLARDISEWRERQGFVTPRDITGPLRPEDVPNIGSADLWLSNVMRIYAGLARAGKETRKGMQPTEYLASAVRDVVILASDPATPDLDEWEAQRLTQQDLARSKLALVVEELGEAADAISYGDRDAWIEELADAMIRLLDLCGTQAVDIELAIAQKMAINRERAYKHGRLA
jgi:NTP pyrophosphatase (non-canonical NTP hydrolase)